MTTAQVVETSVSVNSNSPIQDYVHPADQTQPTYEMTPGFKPFTQFIYLFICFGVNLGDELLMRMPQFQASVLQVAMNLLWRELGVGYMY